MWLSICLIWAWFRTLLGNTRGVLTYSSPAGDVAPFDQPDNEGANAFDVLVQRARFEWLPVAAGLSDKLTLPTAQVVRPEAIDRGNSQRFIQPG
jgi:hypothetical protein